MSSATVAISHHSPTPAAGSSQALLEAGDQAGTQSESTFNLPFDPLRVIDGLYGARWLALALGILGAVALGFLATKRLATKHVATAQLIKLAPQNTLRQSIGGDPYQPHDVTIPNMVAMMWSGAVVEGTIKRTEGRIDESTLRAGLAVNPQRNTDIIHVSMNSDDSPELALGALEAYLAEVLEFTRHIQQHDAGAMAELLRKEITQAEREIEKLNEELLDYSKREDIVDPDKQTDSLLGEIGNHNLRYQTIRLDYETLDLRIAEFEAELAKVSPASASLHQAREELAALRLRYTEEHPTLQNAISAVAALELAVENEIETPDPQKPPRPGENPIAESLYLDLVKLRGQKQALAEQLKKLTTVRENLDLQLEQLPRKALAIARIRARKDATETSLNLLTARLREAVLVQESAEGAFRLLSKDRLDNVSITTPTQKTIIASGIGFAAGSALAFALAVMPIPFSRKINSAADLKRITGLPVLGHAEEEILDNAEARKEWAFTKWTTLLPLLERKTDNEAMVCGLLTSHSSKLPVFLADAAARRGASALLISRHRTPQSVDIDSALDVAGRILDVLTETPEKILHLHVDEDWKWNAEQRSRFQKALGHWSQASGLVIFVELHDPGAPETLLLAETLPNLLWIAKGNDESTLLSEQVRLYRSAGCALSGSLLENSPPYRLGMIRQLERFQKFSACVILAAATLLTTPVTAASDPVLLGPGDKVNIRFAGDPTLSREGITVGPDGTLTYLQAQAIPAAGLSIDGLRVVLNRELSQYYRNIRITVTPRLFKSQRVYVLGKIVAKGAIPLDRPMRVTDVVAAAGGLETGLFQQNTVELADLRRSFLVREGSRIKIDLEQLFLHGDMSHNVAVKGGDYLYFPSANSNEIHIFGNVKMQGTQGLLAHTSVHSAIAQAGGFTEKAFTKRVLVIRGSLESPETFVVDMKSILAGEELGFRLEPKDIVYIADHPWARAEELLGLALDTFCQGAVSAWAGANVGPLIRGPLLPQRR